MAPQINRPRRAFIANTVMSMAAAGLGMFEVSAAQGGAPGELAAITRGTTWLNSPPLTMAGLRGKVVLVDFCTYTCINWLRTLPYLRAWWKAYPDVVLVGVHTPEFAFEHDVANVRRAISRLDVGYPIVLDNAYSIWRALNNHYWPALYFIDAKGRVRNHQFGEGDYGRWEMFIQRLIAEAGGGGLRPAVGSVQATGIESAADWGSLRTPETYVGYERSQNFASRGGVERDRRRAYSAPARLLPNHWALVGDWTVGAEAAALNTPNGRIAITFQARDLHLVMAPARDGRPIRFRATIKGQGPGVAHGLDVGEGGDGVVDEPRLYQLVRQTPPITERLFEIEFLDPGVNIFSFTFG